MEQMKLSDGITLLSGARFSYAAPETADVSIEDIANPLSNICRFAGQLPYFYSVAQHRSSPPPEGRGRYFTLADSFLPAVGSMEPVLLHAHPAAVVADRWSGPCFGKHDLPLLSDQVSKEIRMKVSKIIHLDEDSTAMSSAPVITINHTVDNDIVPLTLIQVDDSIWLGKAQARELYELLGEELKPGGLLA